MFKDKTHPPGISTNGRRNLGAGGRPSERAS